MQDHAVWGHSTPIIWRGCCRLASWYPVHVAPSLLLTLLVVISIEQSTPRGKWSVCSRTTRPEHVSKLGWTLIIAHIHSNLPSFLLFTQTSRFCKMVGQNQHQAVQNIHFMYDVLETSPTMQLGFFPCTRNFGKGHRIVVGYCITK
jgi:hypothetical protein